MHTTTSAQTNLMLSNLPLDSYDDPFDSGHKSDLLKVSLMIKRGVEEMVSALHFEAG